MSHGKKSSFLIFSLLLSTHLFASPWNVEVTPYLWAINMNGTVTIGHKTTHIDQRFTDLLKHLDLGGMLYVTAHQDNLGFYLNGIYAALSDAGDADHISVSVHNKFGIVGAGISYIIFNHAKLKLEPYAGFRHTFNNTTLKIDDLSFKKKVKWTDPVLGLQFDYDFNPCWGTTLVGDIGGISASTQYSYTAGAFLKYQPCYWQHIKTYLGYRLLSQHYETGSGSQFYDWNVKIFGPVLGIGFTF